MNKLLNNIGVVLFAIANVFMANYYIRDIVEYFNGGFSFEGMRYFMPFVVVNIAFLFALALIYFEIGFGKYLIYFLILAVAHNMIFGAGVVGMLFAGLIIATISLIYSIWVIKARK